MVGNGLNTEVVRIEPQHPDHAEGLFSALSDERIYAFLDDGPPQSVDAVRHRIDRLLGGAPVDCQEIWLNWSVFVGEMIVGYTQATLHSQSSATIAYVFSPQVWGSGTAQKAVELMIGQLARQYGVSKVLADTETGNLASQGLLARLGFVAIRRDCDNVFYVKNMALI